MSKSPHSMTVDEIKEKIRSFIRLQLGDEEFYRQLLKTIKENHGKPLEKSLFRHLEKKYPYEVYLHHQEGPGTWALNVINTQTFDGCYIFICKCMDGEPPRIDYRYFCDMADDRVKNEIELCIERKALLNDDERLSKMAKIVHDYIRIKNQLLDIFPEWMYGVFFDFEIEEVIPINPAAYEGPFDIDDDDQ